MPGAAGAAMLTQRASLLYLLGISVRKTLSSTSLEPPSPSSFSLSPSSFLSARSGERKRLLESNVIVANGTPVKDLSSSASVVRKLERILGSLSRYCLALDETSWMKMMSGDLGPSRIWLRMSPERAADLDEGDWIFQVVRESVCLPTA